VTVDPIRIVNVPQNIADYRANVLYVLSLLRALNIEVLWDADDWITNPDTEFTTLQLSYIYECLKTRQCSLPPAHGTSAGVTSGPNGMPRVVGLKFADTPVGNGPTTHRSSKSVLLGSGSDALSFLPIDNSYHANSKYFSTVCPQGLISKDARIVHAAVVLKESKHNVAKRDWNGSNIVSKIKKPAVAVSLALDTLKTNNKKAIVAAGGTTTADLHALTTRGPSGVSAVAGGASAATRLSAADEMSKIAADLASAMTLLEQDIAVANDKKEAAEEALASRYLELEANAEILEHEDYEQRLHALEADRHAMEEEHFHVQVH
jgi:hypothetical protein